METTADIGIRDGVTAHFDALADAVDGEIWGGDPEVVKFDLVAEGLGVVGVSLLVFSVQFSGMREKMPRDR